MNRPVTDLLPVWAVCLTISLNCLGCSTFAGKHSAESDVAPPPTFTVQVRPSGRKSKNIEMVVENDMRLQDAVKASRARFRNKDVYIVRTSPENGQKLKMGATYDSGKKEITMETDYAIHPGDVVVVAEDSTTGVDRMLKGILGRT